MDWRTIIKSNNLRIIVSSILVSLFMILVLSIRFYLTLPFSIEGIFGWMQYALPIIGITAILNKAKDLKSSISTGTAIGFIAGLLFLIYLLIPNLDGEDWTLFIVINISATLVFIISSIIGVVISYFIRKQIRNKKIASQ